MFEGVMARVRRCLVQEVLLLDGKDRKVAKTAIEDCRPTGVQWKESESTGLA
jgi:hypothetical protein